MCLKVKLWVGCFAFDLLTFVSLDVDKWQMFSKGLVYIYIKALLHEFFSLVQCWTVTWLEIAAQWTPWLPPPAPVPATPLSAAARPQCPCPRVSCCHPASIRPSTTPCSPPTTPCKACGRQPSPLSTWLDCSSSLRRCLPHPLWHPHPRPAPWHPLRWVLCPAQRLLLLLLPLRLQRQ